MASPADYIKTDEEDDDDVQLVEHIPLDMPCEIVETTVVDQSGRHIMMAPVQGLTKNDNGAMQIPSSHIYNQHHHQDLEDGPLTYVYESVVPQELYAEPESPGPSRLEDAKINKSIMFIGGRPRVLCCGTSCVVAILLGRFCPSCRG